MKLHLPKVLLAAVMALLAINANTTLGSDIISINFGDPKDGGVFNDAAAGDVGGVEAPYWNHIVGETKDQVNGTYTLEGSSNLTYVDALTLNTTKDPWGRNIGGTGTVLSGMQTSYLDADSNSETWTITLNFAETDYAISEIKLYFSGDGNSGSYSAINFNGISYIGGSEANKQGSGTWGIRSNEQSKQIDADNTLVVNKNLYSRSVIIKDTAGAGRDSLSGMQISLHEVYKTSLTAGTHAAESINWTRSDGFSGSYTDIASAAERFLRADLSAGNATLIFASGAEINTLHAKGGNKLTISSSNSSNSSGQLNVVNLKADEDTSIYVENVELGGEFLCLSGPGTVSLKDVTHQGTITSWGETNITNGEIANFISYGTTNITSGTTTTVTGLSVVSGELVLGEGSQLKASTSIEVGGNTAISLGKDSVFDLASINFETITGNVNTSKGLADLLSTVKGEGIMKFAGGSNLGDGVANRITTRGNVLNFNVTTEISSNVAINSWGSGTPILTHNVNNNLTVGGELRMESGAKLKVNSGTLAAGSIGLGHHGGKAYGHLEIAGGSVVTESIKNTVAADTGNTLTMSDGVLEITTNSGIASGIKINISGGTLKAFSSSWGLVGTGTDTSSLGNVDFDIAEGQILTLSGAMSINGALTHNSAGTLKFADNTILSLTTTGLDSLRKVGVGVTNADKDGDGFGTLGYYLVNGTGSVTYGAGMSVTVGDSSTGYTFENGIISSSSQVYVINSTAKNTGNVDTSATAYHVNEGGVFTLNGGITNELTLSKLLTTTTGEGTLVLGQGVSLTGKTLFGGTLQIEKGAQLQLGTGQTTSVNVTSFDKIVLNGGEIRYAAEASSINAIEVIQDSHFVVFDTNGVTNQLTLGSVSIAGGSTFFVNSLDAWETNSWKQNLYIGSLSGAGKADIYGTMGKDSDGDDQISCVTINSLEDFKGSLSITSRVYDEDDNRYKATVNTGTTGADFEKLEFSGFKLADYDAVFNVQSNTTVDTITADAATLTAGTFKVNLSEGVTLTLGGDTASTSTLGTVVAHTGGNTIHLNETATLNTLSFEQNSGKVTLTGSGVYDLGSYSTPNVSGLTSSSWKGTVKISGGSADGMTSWGTFSDLGNKASWISLSGVQGHLSADKEISNNLILETGTALNIMQGSSDTSIEKYNKFTGSIKGDGEFKFSGWENRGGKYGYHFSGDTSEWTGQFNNASSTNHDVNVYFEQNGTESAPAQIFKAVAEDTTIGVVNTSSTNKLNVHIGKSDTSDAVVQFNGIISGVNKLTVNNRASFERSVDVASVEVAQNAVATINDTLNANTVQLGDTATITRSEGATAASMSKVQMNSAGISSAATDSTKGSITNALIDLQNATSFSISDMTLSNVSLKAAAAGTELSLSNVSAQEVELTSGQFTMANKATVDTGGNTDLLSGITLKNTGDSAASLTVDLGNLYSLGVQEDGKFSLTITLDGFTMESMEYVEGKGLIFAADSWLGQMLAKAENEGAVVSITALNEASQATQEAAVASTNAVTYNSTPGSNVGTVIRITGLSVIPEPATTTLGLVALAALVTRRRRK